MQLEHSFSVPVGVDEAWQVLLDIERVASCMPGAGLDSIDGDEFTGTVKVKLGPIGLTYKGRASFVEKDEAGRRIAIKAQGRDARGNGTAAARVTATLTEEGDSTNVVVVTDLDITGKPAQFGRGVMVDVGNKLIGQFADCLAGKLAGGAEPAPADTAPADTAAAEPAPADTAAAAAAAAGTAGRGETVDTASVGATPEPAVPGTAPAETAAAAVLDAARQGSDGASAPEAAPDSGAGQTAAAATAGQVAAAVPAAATGAAPAPEDRPAPHHHPHLEHAASSARHFAEEHHIEPIDLLQSAGPAVAKRLVPLLAGLVLLLVVLRLRRRH